MDNELIELWYGKDKKMCKHCNGYGSSMKDPTGVDVCTKCGGTGVVDKTKKGGSHTGNT
jgi:DnaJ-class molecular chaperone